MTRASRFVVTAIAVLLMVPAGAGAATEHQLLAVNGAYFSPDRSGTTTIVITQGDTIMFTNADTAYIYGTNVYQQRHSVVDDDPKNRFGTNIISPGQRAVVREVRLLAPGTYPFHCYLHPQIRGTLLVNPAA